MIQTGLLAPDIEMTLYQTHFPVSAGPLSLSAPLFIFPGPPNQCGALGEAYHLLTGGCLKRTGRSYVRKESEQKSERVNRNARI